MLVQILEGDDIQTTLEKHREIRRIIQDRTGFTITDGVCPMRSDADFRAGFCLGIWQIRKAGCRVPVIVVWQTQELLFDTFIAISDQIYAGQDFPATIGVVLESSFQRRRRDHFRPVDHVDNHDDYFSEAIDYPIALSKLWDFENLLVNDGFTGVAIMSNKHTEVQFSEHKLITLYSADQKIYRKILSFLKGEGLRQLPETEEGRWLNFCFGHMHMSCQNCEDEFKRLKFCLGAERD